MRLILSGLFVLPTLFFVLIISAILVGHQQPPSTWATILHLDECELPCWIGIVPGQTTLIEAQQQIEREYGNKSEYQLEEQNDFQSIISYAPTEESFLITFFIEDIREHRETI